MILTVNDKITKGILKDKSCIMLDEFNEANIHNALNKLFKYTPNEIIKITAENKDALLKKSKKSKTSINKFFKSKISNNILCSELKFTENEETKIYNPSLIIASHEEIKSEMDNIDKIFNKKKYNNQNILNKYFRILKTPSKNNKTDCAFATIIILNNTYISSILATGYIMKYINKTKYNLICFVQDKPYYEDGILKFPGLTADDIDNIGLFYDCVVGIDLLKIKTGGDNATLRFHYTNAKYYATKLLCFGFVMYSKILYYDASTIIQSNIDYYMTKYNENKYYNTNNDDLHRGLVGNIYMFIPKTYYIDKALYLMDNYAKIFAKQHSFMLPDEDLEYYTLYPHWSKNQINRDEIASNYINDRHPYIQINKKETTIYNFNLFVIVKPFIYCDNNNYTLFSSNHTCYGLWDEAVSKIIIKYPELNKYFEFIKTFRYTLF